MMLSESPAKIRVVFDTNIYIAAFQKPGLSSELIKQAAAGKFKAYTSPVILLELDNKLEKKFSVTVDVRREFISTLNLFLVMVRPKDTVNAIRRDPEDNKILECALAAQANLTVTLDRDLLELKNWHGIAIVHPKTFTWIVPPPEGLTD